MSKQSTNRRVSALRARILAETNAGLAEFAQLNSAQIREERENLTRSLWQEAGGSKAGVDASSPERVNRKMHAAIGVIMLVFGLLLLGSNTSSQYAENEVGNEQLVAHGTGSSYADQPGKGQVPVRLVAHNDIARQLTAFNQLCSQTWHEFGWIVGPFLIVVAIKLLLLRQSLSEITACGLSLVAFLLTHAIEVVRYGANELRGLAKELRSKRQDHS